MPTIEFVVMIVTTKIVKFMFNRLTNYLYFVMIGLSKGKIYYRKRFVAGNVL